MHYIQITSLKVKLKDLIHLGEDDCVCCSLRLLEEEVHANFLELRYLTQNYSFMQLVTISLSRTLSVHFLEDKELVSRLLVHDQNLSTDNCDVLFIVTLLYRNYLIWLTRVCFKKRNRNFINCLE